MCKEKYSRVCESCVHDCMEYIMYSKNDCENYKLGIDVQEYKDMIRELNVNIKKVCNKNGISNNCMMNMLSSRQPLTFKYRKVLDSVLFEKDEYLPYILEEVANGEK